MRTFKVLSLLLFAALTFNACSSDNDNNDQNPSNSLQTDYFSIESATYVEENLQGGTTDLIEDLHINKTVINGGSTVLYITSATELSSVRVGIQNVKGYYDYALPKAATPASVTLKSVKAGVFEYEVVVLLSQALSAKNVVFTLVAVATDGILGKIFNTDQIDVLPAGTGDLQITLSWDKYDDVDLHLYDAENNHIYFGNDELRSTNVKHPEETRTRFLQLKLMEETDYPVADLDLTVYADLVKLIEYATEAGFPTSGDALELQYKNYLAKNAVKFGIIGMLDIDSNAGCSIDRINNENITYSSLQDGVYKVVVHLWEKCTSSSVEGPKYVVTVNHKGRSVKLSELHKGQLMQRKDNVTIGTFTIRNGELTVGGEYTGNDTTSEVVVKEKVARTSLFN